MCGGRCVSEVWWRGVAEVEKGEVNVVRGRELNESVFSACGVLCDSDEH